MEDIPDDPNRLKIYRLDDGVDKNDLYQMGQILGKNIDKVVEHMNRQLKSGIGVDQGCTHRPSASCVDGKPTGIIRFGHTKTIALTVRRST